MKPTDALDYHSQGRKGKVEVVPTKPCLTQRDLSLAYTPGVAEPCLAIEREPDLAYEYTAKGNLVAVVSNGTAVLGLGNIGPAAGKPVMEGKGVLFKRFADIDVFDLEVATNDPDELIRLVQMLEPTFGGINLEDIKAPECFYIEKKLRETMSIPVFHDDQHGTAIISAAGLINALELAGKKIGEVRMVVSGAGAAAIACCKHYFRLGLKPENVLMVDTKGVLYRGRTDGMNSAKAEFAQDTPCRTLADAIKGADVFIGLSVAGMLTTAMLKTMNHDPIIFAMANPDPEIGYEEARATRDDAIVATGRSDFPNQVNNVLGFPFIFRGALDSRATTINEQMMLAATKALAELARQEVPDTVSKAYDDQYFHFGREYLIPKPFDPRVLTWVAPAVAKAAMETGVARKQLDLAAYREHLEDSLGRTRTVMKAVIQRARSNPKRVVYPEGENSRVIRASAMVTEEHVAKAVLLGRASEIKAEFQRLDLELGDTQIIDPETDPNLDGYVAEYYRLRQRHGETLEGARIALRSPNLFGAMMVRMGHADGMISGLSHRVRETLVPAIRVVGTKPGVERVSAVHVLVAKNQMYFFADTMVNIHPNAKELAEIARLTAQTAREFGVKPRVAFISYSNFGSAEGRDAATIREALSIVRREEPGLVIEGEMQADTAVVPGMLQSFYPFASLAGGTANVLVFPNLDAAHAAYKLVQRLGGAEVIGPILQGIGKPIHVLQNQSELNDVVNLTALAVVEAGLGKPRS